MVMAILYYYFMCMHVCLQEWRPLKLRFNIKWQIKFNTDKKRINTTWSRLLKSLPTNSSASSLQEAGPPWILYNLAGLYWHVAGNARQGIECYRRALRLVPEQFSDVPLSNLAALLLNLASRHSDDVAALLHAALNVNRYEVSCHHI